MEGQKVLCLKDCPNNYEFNGIDLIKFFCAYLVCMIHVPLFQGFDPSFEVLGFALKNGIARIAVPFFFSASGFLLFRKIELYKLDKVRIKKHCFKLLFLLGLWITLLIVGFTDQLWYLSGLVIVTLLFSFLFSKRLSFKLILIISGLLYFVGMLGDSYSGIMESFLNKVGFENAKSVLSVIYNQQTRAVYLGIFSALIFFSIGVLMVYKPIRINMIFAAFGFLLSIALLLFEAFLIRRFWDSYDHNMYISLIPTTFFLIYIATHLDLPNNIYRKLRSIGVLVFFLHIFIYAIIKNAIGALNSLFDVDLSKYTFILVVIFVTALAVFIEYLSNKQRFHFLKYLYG